MRLDRNRLSRARAKGSFFFLNKHFLQIWYFCWSFPSDGAASVAVKGLTVRRQRRVISGRSNGQKTLKSKLMLCSLLVVGCYLCITWLEHVTINIFVA